MTKPTPQTAAAGELRTAEAGHPTWVRWRIAAILMSFTCMNHFNRIAMAVAKESVKQEFDLSDVQMGTVFSSFLLAYTLCMTPGGWLADRFGPRKALLLMGFGTALFVALTGISGYGLLAAGLALPSLVLIRTLMGALTSPLFPAAGRAINSWMPYSQRAWANGLVIGATTLGIGLSHVLFGKLIDACGWRMAFVITGVVTAALAAIWAAYGTNRPTEHKGVNAAELALIEPQSAASADEPAKPDDLSDGWRRLFANRSLMLLTLNYGAVGYFEYMLFYWMEHYFKEVVHFTTEDSRFYATIVPLVMLITMPLGGWLSDRLVDAFGARIGRSSVAIVGMLASAVLLFAATKAQSELAIVGWFMAAHGAIGLCEAPIWVTGLELGGRYCATSAALVNTGGNAGGIIAPQITPLIGRYFDWSAGLGVGSIVCLAAVFLWLGIDPNQKTQAKDQAP